jgi:thiamine biosynthesis lipoprotein
MIRKSLTRRQFLQLIAVGGVAGMSAKLGIDSLSTGKSISETRLLMGTVVNLRAVNDDPTAARAALRACLNRMEDLEALLSRFQSGSQLSQLNHNGVLTKPNQHLVTLVKASQKIGELSKGAFDITVKPVFDALQAGRLPTDEERLAVGYQHIGVDEAQIEFLKPGMGLTLDGIAKGYIVDRGVEVLREHGFENILVEAGGDLVAKGHRAGGDSWRLGVANPPPENASGYLTTFSATDLAVATSGDYLQYFQADKSTHHIIDPLTQTSTGELASVTVLAPIAMLADALSTTLMVLGLDAGLQLANQLPEAEALLVGKDLQTYYSDRFPSA